jgi:sigma54-dependent transcription regulator
MWALVQRESLELLNFTIPLNESHLGAILSTVVDEIASEEAAPTLSCTVSSDGETRRLSAFPIRSRSQAAPKTLSNDADRLRKCLARFGLEFSSIHARVPVSTR